MYRAMPYIACSCNSNDLANQLVYCMAGKRSALLDGYIAYIDIGDGLRLGVTLAFDAEPYHQLLSKIFRLRDCIWNHKEIVQEIRVYKKAYIATSKVACNDK